MRLADVEWDALQEICEHENLSRNKLIEHIEKNKRCRIRTFMQYKAIYFSLFSQSCEFEEDIKPQFVASIKSYF